MVTKNFSLERLRKYSAVTPHPPPSASLALIGGAVLAVTNLVPVIMMDTEDQLKKSIEEVDQVQRSVKKYKRPAISDPPDDREAPIQRPWIDLLRSSSTTDGSKDHEIYVGEGEGDELTDENINLGALNLDCDTDQLGPGRVVVEVPSSEWQQLWRPWHRALIVKPLGRNISYRIIHRG